MSAKAQQSNTFNVQLESLRCSDISKSEDVMVSHWRTVDPCNSISVSQRSRLLRMSEILEHINPFHRQDAKKSQGYCLWAITRSLSVSTPKALFRPGEMDVNSQGSLANAAQSAKLQLLSRPRLRLQASRRDKASWFRLQWVRPSSDRRIAGFLVLARWRLQCKLQEGQW